MDKSVKAVLEAYPKAVRNDLKRLRTLILEAGASVPETGGVIETLKWGQPAYLPKRSRIGSTIRVDALKSEPGRFALLYHCQSRLGEMFRELYPSTFEYDGKRELKFSAGTNLPKDAIRHCVAIALTYHQKKKDY